MSEKKEFDGKMKISSLSLPLLILFFLLFTSSSSTSGHGSTSRWERTWGRFEGSGKKRDGVGGAMEREEARAWEKQGGRESIWR